MDKNELTTFSPSETLKILNHFKQSTREFRKQNSSKAAKEMYELFDSVATIASQNKEELQEIYKDTLFSAKKQLLEQFNADFFLQNYAKNQLFLDLCNPKELKSLKIKERALANSQKKLKDAQNPNKTPEQPANRPTFKPARDSELITQLKAEITAYLEKTPKLTPEEKKQQLQALQNSKAIQVKLKGNKCYLQFDDKFSAVETSLAINGIQFEGKYSRYAGISKEILPQLAQISTRGKSFATAVSINLKKQALQQKDQEKQEKSAQSSIDSILNKIENAKDQLNKAAQKCIKTLDNQKLFNLIAQYQELPQLLYLINGSKQTTKASIKPLVQELNDNIIKSPEIWHLYMEDQRSTSNDKRSYYEKTLEQVKDPKDVYNNVYDLMQNLRFFKDEDSLKNLCEDVIKNKIAGTTVPYQDATNLFLDAVFKYGMAINYNQKFKQENFDLMNKVMNNYGVRIEMQSFKAQKESTQAVMPLSAKILKDMEPNKINNLKALNLLYQVEKLERSQSKPNLSKIYSNPETIKLYAEFCDIFFHEHIDTNKQLVTPPHENQWKLFIKDKENQKNRKKFYDYLTSVAKDEKQLSQFEKDLAKGRYISSNNLTESSTHHNIPRKFGGLFEEPSKLLNEPQNLTITTTFHPTDDDPHKGEHRYDTNELYYWIKDEKPHKGNISAIEKGDTVFIPIIKYKQPDGTYAQNITSGMLFVSEGIKIDYPHFGNNDRQNMNIISQYKDNKDNKK